MVGKIDLILQWCVYCDYPIWRAWLKKYRSKFNKVILYPSRHHGSLDLESFAKDQIKEVWVDPVEINWGIEDWRQAETDPCLLRSDSEWIMFNEQDFFCKDWDRFFDDIERIMTSADMSGLWSETHFSYIHPSCLLIKRELLERTNKDFKAHPEIMGSDHFAMITNDALKLGAEITTLQDIGYDCGMTPEADAFHLGGLTYVYQDWKSDGEHTFGVKNLEAFAAYNYELRQVNLPQDPKFLDLSREIEEVLLEKISPTFNLANNPWTKFFKP